MGASSGRGGGPIRRSNLARRPVKIYTGRHRGSTGRQRGAMPKLGSEPNWDPTYTFQILNLNRFDANFNKVEIKDTTDSANQTERVHNQSSGWSRRKGAEWAVNIG